mmetsp:Transcript_26512/g.60376  ORF Transcript_26512/g.60376 Transcript_26512/m.60376 type:complete len:417 (-) Transcript_26512:1359-2609(-)
MDSIPRIDILVEGDLLLDLVEREGGDHLHGHQGHVGQAQLLPLGQQFVVNLTRAEDQALHTLGCDSCVPLGDQALELRVGAHVLHAAHAVLVPQQRLRRSDDQGLAEVAMELLPQRMEVVGGRRQVHDLPIAVLHLPLRARGFVVGNVVLVVVAELEEALEAGRGVLSTLAVVAVRQQHGEGGLLQPLVLACADELVEHHLCRVGEVAELCLPYDQSVRVLVAVAQLETQHSVLCQDGIAGNEALLRPQIKVVEEHVHIVCGLVVDSAMAVRERAPLHVLARDANVVPFQEQGAESEPFGRAPVHASASLHALALIFHDPLEAVVHLETLGHLAEAHADLLQEVDVDARLLFLSNLVWRAHALPLGGQPLRLLRRLVGLSRHEVSLVLLQHLAVDLLQLRLCRDAVLHETICEEFH